MVCKLNISKKIVCTVFRLP